MLRDGHPDEDCVAFLTEMTLVRMGLGLSWREVIRLGPWNGWSIKRQREMRARDDATATVAAIRRYVEELDADWLDSS